MTLASVQLVQGGTVMSRRFVFLATLFALFFWPGAVLAQEPVDAPEPATVIVEWATESEVNLAGFNLYRSEDPEGPYVKLNEVLIPASPDPLAGGRYLYTDTTAIAGVDYYYRLEDVELDGSGTMYGPIEVVASADANPKGFDIGGLVAIVLSAAVMGITALVLVQRRRACGSVLRRHPVERDRTGAGPSSDR
jgi:hypothetical protein